MELWVRSQDKKELVKVGGEFHIEETRVNPHSHRWGIMIDGYKIYGDYKSETRAIEVLDEIENVFMISKGFNREYTYTGTGFYSVDNQLAVYEMPEE